MRLTPSGLMLFNVVTSLYLSIVIILSRGQRAPVVKLL